MKNIIHVLNGPNLNLLGEREPEVYGHSTLADVEQMCREVTQRHGLELVFRQTHAEYEMITWLHEARHSAGIAVNPAAFCYYSVPIVDAIKMCTCPVVELHISNVYQREPWRSESLLKPVTTGMITGLGVDGYRLAIEHLAYLLAKRQK